MSRMNHNIIPIVEEILEKIITNIETCNHNKKSVSFYERCNIFTIVSIDDTEYYQNKRHLWWSKVDYFYFRISAKHDLLHLINDYKKNSNIDLSVKDAITLLYQQDN